MNYVVDFTGYYAEVKKSKKEFIIKEFCLIPIAETQIQAFKSGVVCSKYRWRDLTSSCQKEYRFRFYRKYGIEYDDCDCSLTQAMLTITNNLKEARIIYVKNKSKKRFLAQSTQMVFNNVVCLRSRGYKLHPKVSNEICTFHASNENCCSVQNAVTMAQWVVDKLPKAGDNNAYVQSMAYQLSKLKPGYLLDKFKTRDSALVYPKSSDEAKLLEDSDDDWSNDFDYQSQSQVSDDEGSRELNDRLERHLKEVNHELDGRGSKSNYFEDSDVEEMEFDENDKLENLDFENAHKFRNKRGTNSRKLRNPDDDLMEIDFRYNRIVNQDSNNINKRNLYDKSKIVPKATNRLDYCENCDNNLFKLCRNKACKKRIREANLKKYSLW